jgi:hypothetical protein
MDGMQNDLLASNTPERSVTITQHALAVHGAIGNRMQYACLIACIMAKYLPSAPA